MKKFIITVISLLCCFAAVFGGCAYKIDSEHIGRLEEEIKKLNEKMFEIEKELTNQSAYYEYKNNMSEWQKAADEETFIVAVNTKILETELNAEQLEPLEIISIYRIDGVIARTEKDNGDSVKFYTVTTREGSDSDLQILNGFEFIDYAWRNEFDYQKRTDPVEEKKPFTIPNDWSSFHGSFDIKIDKSYRFRIFTSNDFSLKNVKRVEWISYFQFKTEGAIGNYDNHRFRVFIPLIIPEKENDKSARDTQAALDKINFVQSSRPNYGVDDFMGYPSD